MKKNLKFVLFFAAGIMFLSLTSKAQSNFGNDWKLRKDLPVFSEPEIKSIQANIYQNGDKVRLAFLLSENPDIYKAECELSFDPMYFFILGMPVLNDTKTDEKMDIDYKFENERLIFEVTVNDYQKYIEFGVASRKLKNLGTLTAEEKVKHIALIR